MADLQIVDIGTTKTDSTIDADGDYLAADTTAGATYKALVDDFVIAALAQTASTVAIAADVNVDSGVLFVDVSENRVGINDATPTYGLDVNGTFRTTGAAQFDSTVAITNDLNINSGALFVDVSAGRVGIGTTSLDTLLHIQDYSAAPEMRIESGASGQHATIGSANEGATGACFYIKVKADGAATTERFRITASGSVGIGTTSPTAKLQVNGSFAVVDGMSAPSTISGYALIYVDSSDGDLKVKFGDGTVKTIATDT